MTIPEKYPMTYGDCIYKALRNQLIFGKLLGVIPIKGLFETNNGVEHLSVRYIVPQSVVTLFIVLMQTVRLAFAIFDMVNTKKRSAYKFVKAVFPVVANLNLLFGYLYLLRNSNGLIKLFRKWRSIQLHFTKYDNKLRRDVLVVQCIAFVCTGVYMFLYYHMIVEASQEQTKSFLQIYYEGIFNGWAKRISYNPVLSVILIYFDLVDWCLTSYVEVFIIIITRAFYLKFKVLVNTAEHCLVGANRNVGTATMYWIKVTTDYDTLCKLLEQFAEFLSPIIAASYAANIYNVGVKLVRILSGHRIKQWYFFFWSLLFTIGKVWFVTCNAVNVNDTALMIRRIFRNCPNEYYSLNVHRAVQRIEKQPNIGFHGLRCFYITKPFFLTILSTIFTIQIILLSQP